MTARTIPTATGAITADWLTTTLREFGTIAGDVTVASVQAEVLPSGVGFMGEVGRLRLTYSGRTSAPTSIIAKIPTQNEVIRGMLAPANIFEREARFYGDVCPEVPTISGEAFGIAIDKTNEDYLLLIEDLSAYRMGDQLSGLSVDDAYSALTAAALLHSTYWQSTKLDKIDWMPACNSAGMKIGEHVYAQSLDPFKQIFGHAIEPEHESLIDRFGPNTPLLLDSLAAMPMTVAHFDYRLDNLFFGDDGVVKMIDFQTSSKGGFIYDIGYLLSQSMRVEDRRTHEDALLQAYHGALVSGGVSGYSLDQLRADYRIGVLYGWIIPVFAVGSLDVSSERAMALWTEVIKRAQAAMSDHHVADLLQV
jgi:hypothetical protein